MINKIRSLWVLDHRTMQHLPESTLMILFAYILMVFQPYKKLIKHLGVLSKETSQTNLGHESLLYHISQAILITSNNVPWEASCFVQTIAAKLMLRRRNLDSTLYLGVSKNSESVAKGHAWLRCGDFIVAGKKGHKEFNVIAMYS